MNLITDEDYEKYLKEAEELIDKDPSFNSPEGERLLKLSFLIKEYETKRFYFRKPTAIEAIRFRMEQQNLNESDLIPYIGSAREVFEVLSGKRSLSDRMIDALYKNLDIPLNILEQGKEQELPKV